METKKQKIAVYAGLCAVILTISWVSWQIFKKTVTQSPNASQGPMVLGAQIDARGQSLPENPPNTAPKIEVNKKLLEKLSAKSYIIFDPKTGEDLAELDSEASLPVASLTKLMTAYVAYKELDMQSPAEITPQKYWGPLPGLKLAPKDKILTQDLFDAMLIGSANDAAFALAEVYESRTGKDFVEQMNLEAKNLGMFNTSFSNPAGFDTGQNFSTARDLKILIQKIYNLPAFKNLARRTSHSFTSLTGHKYYIAATNKLLNKYPDILAVKTGYTKKALGSMATVIESGENEAAVIVLDSRTRESDTLTIRRALLNADSGF